jgi:hypothetical protein
VGAASADLLNGIEGIKKYRQTFGVSLGEAKSAHWGDALAHYNEITGFNETDPHGLWHHRISLYGPPRVVCGRPLRTPRAKLCVECGAAVADPDFSTQH